MPCSHMLYLTLVVVQVIFRTNQVVVPVTVPDVLAVMLLHV